MANVIDLKKISEVFDFLAETKEGQKELAILKKTFDNLGSKVKPSVNRAELVYILRALTNQMSLEEESKISSPFKTDEKTLTGLLFQEKPGTVTRLGSKIESGLLMRNVQGFRIRLKI